MFKVFSRQNWFDIHYNTGKYNSTLLYYINMYLSKHASFSIGMDVIMSLSHTHTHTHTHTSDGQFCRCSKALSSLSLSLSLSLSHTHTHTQTHTAQHFNRLITVSDWQDGMNPLKSSHKKSSRHSGSYKHRHNKTIHLITCFLRWGPKV